MPCALSVSGVCGRQPATGPLGAPTRCGTTPRTPSRCCPQCLRWYPGWATAGCLPSPLACTSRSVDAAVRFRVGWRPCTIADLGASVSFFFSSPLCPEPELPLVCCPVSIVPLCSSVSSLFFLPLLTLSLPSVLFLSKEHKVRWLKAQVQPEKAEKALQRMYLPPFGPEWGLSSAAAPRLNLEYLCLCLLSKPQACVSLFD